MDHDATREQLDLAAAEPDGLDRLMAGDTATAQAVAGHLAGCPSCTDELDRLARAASLIRAVVREAPPADLRERTLAAVRTAGVPRGPARLATGSATRASSLRWASGASRGRAVLGWVATLAAAVSLSVLATSQIVGSRVDERLAAYEDTVGALQQVAISTLQVTGEPDARHVALAGASATQTGSLVFSPTTSELVVVATGLTPPPEGQEYRCWVEQAGDRESVGKMFFSDDLAYWIGPVPAVEGLVGDATFGVTLVDLTDGGAPNRDVLVGGL